MFKKHYNFDAGCCNDFKNNDGNSFKVGTNFPYKSKDGDSFLNSETGDLFVYKGYDWIKKSNLRGNKIYNGSGHPSKELIVGEKVQNGDYYINRKNGDMYFYDMLGWNLIADAEHCKDDDYCKTDDPIIPPVAVCGLLNCWKESCGTGTIDSDEFPYSMFVPIIDGCSNNRERLAVLKSVGGRSVVIQPEGEGFFSAQLPDGAVAGGNIRGAHSTDFQRVRDNADQVASGIGSGIFSGKNNKASGDYSTADGIGTQAEGIAARTWGDAETGTIRSSSIGGTAFGKAADSGQIIVEGNSGNLIGEAGVAFGEASGVNSKIYIPPCIGSLAHGYADGAGEVFAAANASTAIGRATDNGQIYVERNTVGTPRIGEGGMAFGKAEGENSKIYVPACAGSLVFGYAGTGGQLTTEAYTNSGTGVPLPGDTYGGSLTFGAARDGGVIRSGSDGSFAAGRTYIDNSLNATAEITSSYHGSSAQGRISIINSPESQCKLTSAYGGSNVRGSILVRNSSRHSGEIIAKSSGSSASGEIQIQSSPNNNLKSTIEAGVYGSYARGKITCFGMSNISSSIVAKNHATTAIGYVYNGGKIQAGNEETLDTRSPSAAAFAVGYVDRSDEITSSFSRSAFAIGRDVSIPPGFDYSMILGQYGEMCPPIINSALNPPYDANGPQFQLAAGSNHNSKTAFRKGIALTLSSMIVGSTPRGVGTAEQWQNGGADYAEFFEWFDGNHDNQFRLAYFVKIKSDQNNSSKIIIADTIDGVFGVTSSIDGEIGVIGDAAALGWAGAPKRDKYGRSFIRYSYREDAKTILQMNNVVIDEKLEKIIDDLNPKKEMISGEDMDIFHEERNKFIDGLSNYNYEFADQTGIDDETTTVILPIEERKQKLIDDLSKVKAQKVSVETDEYDPTREYIPRSARKEWTPVSMLGKVRVRDNGQCIPGTRCTCENGIAVPGDKYMVLARIAEDVIRILLV